MMNDITGLGRTPNTMPSESTPETDQKGTKVDETPVWKEVKAQVDACKNYRKKLIPGWTTSIDYRRGKPFASQTDEDRVAVPIDWQLTKSKQALLFSQVPSARVSHPPQTLQMPSLHAFEQKLNDTLIQAGIETAMDEVLPDCINAAGFGVVIVSREAITEDVEVPVQDMSLLPPEMQAVVMQTGTMPDGSPIEMTTVPRVVDQRYVISRVSPADFIWPISFTGSDFDNAPLIGRRGRVSWPEAVIKFKLTEEDKERCLGEDRSTLEKLTHDVDKDKIGNEGMVGFDEVYVREYQFDPQAKSFSTIRRLVFVDGKDKPVIDQPWEGQQIDENGKVIGCLKYPIRVLTTTYITDECIPPSDSAIGRSQVNELNKSRTQWSLQRERSLPIRWVDINRVDPSIAQALMRGVTQAMIPTQGPGGNVIGEVTRAQLGQEDFTIDQIVKSDLMEAWQVGQGDSGMDIETKGEASVVQNNMQTRIGRDRAKVGKFFCSIAEVLGGLLCLFEDPASFGDGFNPMISTGLSYSILADSTLLLDSEQRIKRRVDFLNFAGKTGWVNIEPVIREIATLSGLDPSAVIQAPQPKPPDQPNISLRLTGTEDLLQPMAVALLMKSGQAPDQELIEKAKQLILTAVIPPPNAIHPPPPEPTMGPDGQMMPPPEQAPGVPVPIPVAPPIPVDVPHPPVTQTGEAHPNWSAMPRVNQRVLDRGQH